MMITKHAILWALDNTDNYSCSKAIKTDNKGIF